MENLDSQFSSAHSIFHPVIWAIRLVNRETSFPIPLACNPCLFLSTSSCCSQFQNFNEVCACSITLSISNIVSLHLGPYPSLALQLEWVSWHACHSIPAWNADLTVLSKMTMTFPKQPFQTHLYSVCVLNKILIYENIHKSSKLSLCFLFPDCYMVEFST